MNNNNDYAVGYGKPPKEKQFQKGRSGNPSGRPKGSKSYKNIPELIQKICHASVKVKDENGKYFYISKVEAVMTQLINSAAKGDPKAARTLFHILKAFPVLMQAPPPPIPIVNIRFVSPKHKQRAELDGAPKDSTEK